jgi:hypothetical protein
LLWEGAWKCFRCAQAIATEEVVGGMQCSGMFQACEEELSRSHLMETGVNSGARVRGLEE